MSLQQVALAAGMSVKSHRWGPCPACQRMDSDGRGPVLLGRRDKWRCVLCGEGGDDIALAGAHLGLGCAPRGRDYWKAKRFVDAAGGVVVEPEPDRAEDAVLPLAETLAACIPLPRVRDENLDPFLESKGLTRACPARYLARPPDWFPAGYPLVVPAFNGKGELKSMHGRAVTPRPKGKTKTWPRGVRGSFLLLDPRWVRPWVQGLAPPPGRVLLTEGITDYLNGAMRMPTIGLTNGSFEALRLIRFHRDTRIVSAVDPDAVGDRYEEQLADAIWPAVARDVPLERVSKVLGG